MQILSKILHRKFFTRKWFEQDAQTETGAEKNRHPGRQNVINSNIMIYLNLTMEYRKMKVFDFLFVDVIIEI